MSTADTRIGTEIIGYRIDALVGRGGMGVVYKAYDQRLKRYVALKLIAPELSGDERFRERFLTETELAASLEHPNVVPIHDAGEVDGQLYIAMRYVEGSDLKRLLQTERVLDPGRAVAICGQVAAALDAAHARGLVHRDVKPSNVLLDEDEHVYLADFGLSRRLTDLGGRGDEGLSVGTPAYASPEQIDRGSVDGRADEYALGCLLYECLTGEAPFRHDSELAVLWAHVQEPPPAASEHNPGLPIEIDDVIGKAMAKSPDDRYGSCGELVVAARDALGLHQPVVSHKRRSLALAVAGAALIAALVLAGVLLNQGNGGRPRRPGANPTLTPKADALQRIDPRTNKLVATIAAGAGAEAVAAGDGAVFVANTSDKTVSRIDPRSNTIVKRVSASGLPTSIALGRPQDAALWVVTNDHPYDPCSLSQLDEKTLSTNNTTNNFPDNACGPVVTADGQTWFGGSSNFLVLVDPGSGTSQRMIPTGSISGSGAHGLAVGAGAVWLASPNTEELYRYDGRRRRAIELGPGSFASDVAVGESAVWVTDSAHDTVIEIDPSRDRIVRRVRVGRGPFAVAVGSGAVWVADDPGGTLSRIDPRTGRVTTFPVGPHPRDIAVGEGAVWVTVHPS